MLRRVRAGLGLVLLAASILFLVWGFVPAHREMRIRPLSVSLLPALQERRQLSLLFPPKIRSGEVGIVRLTLGVDASVNATPPAENGSTKSESSRFYDTHYVIVETRFDLPGMEIRPSDLISAPIERGQTPVFYWTLRPHKPGIYTGTVWLYLRTVDKTTGEARRETASVQNVELEAVSLLGLTINQTRLIGIAAIVIGLALSIPFFEAQAKNLLKNRRNP